jgi:transposase
VVVACGIALFRICRRDRATFQQLLPPEISRPVGSDRYIVYESVAAFWRQLCWAHLKRNFQALSDLGSGPGLAVGHWTLDQIRELFRHWHAYRCATLSREELQVKLAPVQEQFTALLRTGAASNCRRTRTLCTGLQHHWEALWTFALRDGVEPTNNAAERALRSPKGHPVLWRKGSFGHRSDRPEGTRSRVRGDHAHGGWKPAPPGSTGARIRAASLPGSADWRAAAKSITGQPTLTPL